MGANLHLAAAGLLAATTSIRPIPIHEPPLFDFAIRDIREVLRQPRRKKASPAKKAARKRQRKARAITRRNRP